MAENNIDILVVVEDPGALNFVWNLADQIKNEKLETVFVVGNQLAVYAEEKGILLDFLVYDGNAELILKKYNPRICLLGTAENLEGMMFDFLFYTKNYKICSVAFIDAFVNADKRFKKNSLIKCFPDYLCVADEETKKEYILQEFDEKKIFVCGNPYYDYVYTYANKEKLKKINDKKKIVFIAETGIMLDDEVKKNITTTKFKGWKNSLKTRERVILEAFIDIVHDVVDRNVYDIILRLHPKNKENDFKEYYVYFDQVSQGGNSLDLLNEADLVVGMTSMALLEAALLKKKTLSLLISNREKKWLPTIEKGITISAFCPQEAKKCFIQLLANEDSENCVDDELLKKVCFLGSTQLFFEKVLMLVNSLTFGVSDGD